MDPFAAMGGQVGPGPAGAPPMAIGTAPQMGGGMPPLPGMDGDIDDAMLMALMSGQGNQDPYSVFPGESQSVFDGIGVAPPQMGLEQMIKLLMLAQAGVAHGSPVNSSSGLAPDPPSDVMSRFGSPGGNVGFGMY